MVVIVASESGSGNSFATSRTAASLASMPASCIIILPPSSSSSFEETDCVAGGKKVQRSINFPNTKMLESTNQCMYTTSNRFDFFGAWESKQTTQEGMEGGGAGGGGGGGGKGNKIGQLARNTDLKPLATVVQNANCSRSSIWFERQKSVHFPRHLRYRSRTFPKCDEEQCLKKFHCRSSFPTSLCVSPLFSLERYVCSSGLLWVPFLGPATKVAL